jgi:hypothetical protein
MVLIIGLQFFVEGRTSQPSKNPTAQAARENPMTMDDFLG